MHVQLAPVSSGPVCAAHLGPAAFHACHRLAATACAPLGGATESAVRVACAAPPLLSDLSHLLPACACWMCSCMVSLKSVFSRDGW